MTMEYTIEYVEKAFITVPDLIEHQAKHHGDRDALIINERRLDYHRLNRLVDKGAAALQNAGYGEGDCISICGRASIEYIIIFLAGLRAGLVVAPLPDSASSETLRSMIQDCAAKIIFHDTLNHELIHSATQGLNLNRAIFDETKSVYDNDFQRMLDRWNENMDEKLPNYATKIEQEEGFLKSMGSANFWANDVLGAMSFTLGAVLTEMVWSAATAATLGSAAPLQAGATSAM